MIVEMELDQLKKRFALLEEFVLGVPTTRPISVDQTIHSLDIRISALEGKYPPDAASNIKRLQRGVEFLEKECALHKKKIEDLSLEKAALRHAIAHAYHAIRIDGPNTKQVVPSPLPASGNQSST
jgi:hypothetical protein